MKYMKGIIASFMYEFLKKALVLALAFSLLKNPFS